MYSFIFLYFAVGIEEEKILSRDMTYYPYYGIPSTIAVNMIMAAASGGIVAIAIAVWAQVRQAGERDKLVGWLEGECFSADTFSQYFSKCQRNS